MKKIKRNLTICISDTHWGDENCLYSTYWYVLEKLIQEIDSMMNYCEFNAVNLVLNGDMVSGTQIYRNQYLQNHLNKDEDIILFGSFLIYKTIKLIEKITGIKIKTYVTAGNHEIGRNPLPHNFILALSRRLNSYGIKVRYASDYLILDIAKGISDKEYNVNFYHGWGSSDYSSITPSLVREFTRVQGQFARDYDIIIKRHCAAHTHWLETGRSMLGILADCTGGFQKWIKKMSYRESGILYYTYDEGDVFNVKEISGLKKQLEEIRWQGLHVRNMRYVADILQKAMDNEIELGLLNEKGSEEK